MRAPGLELAQGNVGNFRAGIRPARLLKRARTAKPNRPWGEVNDSRKSRPTGGVLGDTLAVTLSSRSLALGSFLLLSVALGCRPSPGPTAGAAPSAAPAPSAPSAPSAVDAGPAPRAEPETDPRAAIVAAAGLGPVDALTEVRRFGGGWVVLRTDGASVDAKGGHLTLRVAIVSGGGDAGAPTRAAEGRIAVERADCTQTAGPADGPTAVLDLAPYRLDAATTAIGARVTCGRTFPAGEGVATTLHLLRPSGGALTEVFRATVEDHDHQRGPGDELDVLATVAVEPARRAAKGAPAGLADVVVRRTTSRSRIGESAAPTRTTTVERFAWDGARYAPAR